MCSFRWKHAEFRWATLGLDLSMSSWLDLGDRVHMQVQAEDKNDERALRHHAARSRFWNQRWTTLPQSMCCLTKTVHNRQVVLGKTWLVVGAHQCSITMEMQLLAPQIGPLDLSITLGGQSNPHRDSRMPQHVQNSAQASLPFLQHTEHLNRAHTESVDLHAHTHTHTWSEENPWPKPSWST